MTEKEKPNEWRLRPSPLRPFVHGVHGLGVSWITLEKASGLLPHAHPWHRAEAIAQPLRKILSIALDSFLLLFFPTPSCRGCVHANHAPSVPSHVLAASSHRVCTAQFVRHVAMNTRVRCFPTPIIYVDTYDVFAVARRPPPPNPHHLC